MTRLLLLFIAVPAVELILLIEIGQRVGSFATIGLIIGTGIIGAALAKQQGINTLARLRKDLNNNQLPAEPIVDGLIILLAATVLITPGVITDLVGFLCLVPTFRDLLKNHLKRKFGHVVRRSSVGATLGFNSADVTSQQRTMKNVTRQ
jgi:UPF0716 protein FxsA